MTKIMMICAESSGDFLAAELVDSLKNKDSTLEFTDSVIGSECQKRGLNSIIDLSVIAKMGFVEILTLIPTLFKLRSQILKIIEMQKPDCIILVDGFAFTHFVAKKIRKKYPHIKLVKYIAPKLWAWAPWRAYKLRGVYDLILSCLPFETEFFKQKNIDVTFVGHSVLQRIKMLNSQEKQNFKQLHQIPNDKKVILLLPGSRHAEIIMLKPIFLNTAYKFDTQTHHFIVPIASGKAHYFADLPKNYTVITQTEDRFKAFQISDTALAASGTVSLELMVCQVPTVIAYKVSWLTAKIAQWLVNVPYVTLLNIMMNKEIFPEFLQNNCQVNSLYLALYKNLYDIKTIDYQKQYCIKGTNSLSTYNENNTKIPPNSAAADQILTLLGALKMH